MQNRNLYLPGFYLATLRHRPRSAAQKLADEKARIRQHSISLLGDCFGHFIPPKTLENGSDGAFSRRRLFSKVNTFWAFFSQTLDADGGCQEVVRKVQAFAAARSMPVPSSSTSAYCQSRGKLDPAELEKILAHTTDELQQQGRSRWWKDRRVVVVDGTGVSMADTPANQQDWPQPNSQKPGCAIRDGPRLIPVQSPDPRPTEGAANRNPRRSQGCGGFAVCGVVAPGPTFRLSTFSA